MFFIGILIRNFILNEDISVVLKLIYSDLRGISVNKDMMDNKS